MRRIFFLILFSISFPSLFAGFNDGKVSKFIEFDLASTTTRGIERYNTTYSVSGGFNSHWVDAITGIQCYKDVFDYTLATEVWLPFTNWQFETSRIALGLGGLYHYQKYKDISSEHDFLFDTTFRYQSKAGTTISFTGGYAGKITHLDALAEIGAVSTIYDKYPQAGMLIDKVWSNGFELYFEHSLHSLFRYPLFCTPHYLLGAAVNVESGLRFSGDISMQIADGYAASPYVNGMILKFALRYTF